VSGAAPALSPDEFIRSVRATQATLGRPASDPLDLVQHVRVLTDDAPYAVIGGLAQILWARKSHTDDLDVAITSSALGLVKERIRDGAKRWAVPTAPDRFEETNEVFSVCHALYDGAVVDLITFAEPKLTEDILTSAVTVGELGGIRFIRPELLVVTQLLRPGPNAALAAIELVVARQARGGLDLAVVRDWAARLGHVQRLERVLEQARALDSI
jgi:hypothetical protein